MKLFIITGMGWSAGMHFIAVHPAGQFMKAGGIGPSHSKRKTTCLIALQSLCPGAPRSAWVPTVHIFGIFFFSFFLFFLFFSSARRGPGRARIRSGPSRVCCLTHALLLPAAFAGDQNQENGHRQFSQIDRIQ